MMVFRVSKVKRQKEWLVCAGLLQVILPVTLDQLPLDMRIGSG